MSEPKGVETMGEMMTHGVPLDAIAKGRNLEAVLTEYRRIWKDANEAATSAEKTQDEIFADTLMCAAYRIYLLGVEDGMKEGGGGYVPPHWRED